MIRRIVLDTNIYISALYYGGKPKRVLELASAGELQLLISLPLKLELERYFEKSLTFRLASLLPMPILFGAVPNGSSLAGA
jgi:predicted nucleic acid-binding protein